MIGLKRETAGPSTMSSTLKVVIFQQEIIDNYRHNTIFPLGRPRRRWVDDIRMDLQEVWCGYMDWIGLALDRDRWRTFVSAVMNFRAPWNVGDFLTSCKPVSFSRRTLHHGVSKQASSVDKKNKLDVTFCILYFSSNSCSICFGRPCARHQELTTAWCYSLVLVCAEAAGRWSSPVGR